MSHVNNPTLQHAVWHVWMHAWRLPVPQVVMMDGHALGHVQDLDPWRIQRVGLLS